MCVVHAESRACAVQGIGNCLLSVRKDKSKLLPVILLEGDEKHACVCYRVLDPIQRQPSTLSSLVSCLSI